MLEKICQKFVKNFLYKNFGEWGIWKILNEAERVGSKNLVFWVVWYLRVNYASHVDRNEFKEIKKETQELIIQGHWPGFEYENTLKQWEIEHKKGLTPPKNSNNCSVQ